MDQAFWLVVQGYAPQGYGQQGYGMGAPVQPGALVPYGLSPQGVHSNKLRLTLGFARVPRATQVPEQKSYASIPPCVITL